MTEPLRRARRLLPAVLALVLIAGCSAQTPQAVPPRSSDVPASGAESECTSDGLAFGLGGADAAMGVRVVNIEIVNCGRVPVTVDGYPSLRLFGAERESLAVVVAHGSASVASVPALDVPPAPVVLAPGESAWAGMVWRNLVTDAIVPATNGVGLDVAVSQDAPWQHVPMTRTDQWGDTVPMTIDLGNTDEIGIGPWQRRPSEQTEQAEVPGQPNEDDRR